MEIKHANGARDRVDEEVNGVPITMLNLLMEGKFLKRIETLAANRAYGVEEVRRGDGGDRHGDIKICKTSSRELTKRAHEGSRRRRNGTEGTRHASAKRIREETRAREPRQITTHSPDPPTVTIPKRTK